MIIVDAHLDLAYNALRGREVTRAAREQRGDDEGTPTVGLPDLRAGGVNLICATIFCEPQLRSSTGYRTADEAAEMARRQIEWYRKQEEVGPIAIVERAENLPDDGNRKRTHAIVLMEGADPVRSPEDVQHWFEAGVRIVGLAWKRTRYAGGTGAPGPLTPDGVALVPALDHAGMIHDLSHLAEESFWQLLDLASGPVMASHSNCRAIVPTDRQLSDAMIKAIVARGGVIGINFFDKFLLPPDEQSKRRATLKDVIIHIRHIVDLAGSAAHAGIGTDLDGGFGRERIPAEMDTAADLPRLADALSAAGFSDDDVRGVMGGNWLRFFRESLPRT